jgi:RNA polymerase primary sigma factor
MRQLVISKNITYREYASLDKYFVEIDKIGLITAGEEVMLAKKIREGDKEALERLTKTNLRFVISVAKQYQNQGLILGDLINEGNVGLITAAKRYDETKGFKFISYAVWWIRQAIIAAIAENSRMVRLPYNQLALLNKSHKASSKLEQNNGRKPTADELAECLDVPVQKLKDTLNSPNSYLSIHEPFRHGMEHTLLDVLEDSEPATDHDVMRESVTREIRHSLKVLNSRERDLLILYFGLEEFSPMTMEEIGKKFNISKEHVRRLKDIALTKLRRCSHARVLFDCLS